jgi:hypothetical protein
MMQRPSVRQTNHQLMLTSKSRSRKGTGRNIPVGYGPSHNPLVDVPVQKTHKNRNWLETETEAEAVSVRRSLKQSIGLMFPGPKDTYQWKLKIEAALSNGLSNNPLVDVPVQKTHHLHCPTV